MNLKRNSLIVLIVVVLLIGFIRIPIQSSEVYECLYWEPGNQNIVKKSVEIKSIHYRSLFAKDYEEISVSIDNNGFSMPVQTTKLENGMSFANINRLKLSKKDEYYRWATIVFYDNKFNISSDGNIITWDHKCVKERKDNNYKGNNSLFVNSVNITAANNKEEIIDFINNINEKNDTGESVSSDLIIK